LPLSELGKVAGVPTPIFDALITICSFLLDQNFRKEGRSLINLGLEKYSVNEIKKIIM
jgi:opine dehydrogenase